MVRRGIVWKRGTWTAATAIAAAMAVSTAATAAPAPKVQPIGIVELKNGEKVSVARFGTFKEPHDVQFTDHHDTWKLAQVKEATRDGVAWQLVLADGRKAKATWIFRVDGQMQRMAAGHRERGDRTDASIAFVGLGPKEELKQYLVGSDDVRRIAVERDPGSAPAGRLSVTIDFDAVRARYVQVARLDAAVMHKALIEAAHKKGVEIVTKVMRPSVIRERDASDIGGLIAEQTIDTVRRSLAGSGYRCATKEDVLDGKMLPEDWADCELRKEEVGGFAADLPIEVSHTPLTSVLFDQDELGDLKRGRIKRAWISLTNEEAATALAARAAREKDAQVAEAEARQRLEKAAAGWRKRLKVGDDTHCGLIVEIKPPIAQIQTANAPTWMKIEQLYPPRTLSCTFVNGRYLDPN